MTLLADELNILEKFVSAWLDFITVDFMWVNFDGAPLWTASALCRDGQNHPWPYFISSLIAMVAQLNPLMNESIDWSINKFEAFREAPLTAEHPLRGSVDRMAFLMTSFKSSCEWEFFPVRCVMYWNTRRPLWLRHRVQESPGIIRPSNALRRSKERHWQAAKPVTVSSWFPVA